MDEALNRTPTGGFPELEQPHGLPAGTLFDWVEKFGPAPPPAPFSALHFWIGSTELDETQFGAYFDNPPSYWQLDVEDIEAVGSDVTGCGFCRDLGRKLLYDEDLLLVIWLEVPVPVEEIVAMSALASEDSARGVVAACAGRGIERANAMFVYADPTQEILDPARLFNGLSYVGLFTDELPRKSRRAPSRNK
ncbi:immunity 22 family protein [Sphingomonas sp. MS122]|uniref:immunity 22 family protein n=1 Tax=Sphingomonas sp. MS122 TaxID=3412683 RepID=UPI003C2F54F5